eukprot:6181144-Pleurochrysis_carterae.AAC.6
MNRGVSERWCTPTVACARRLAASRGTSASGRDADTKLAEIFRCACATLLTTSRKPSAEPSQPHDHSMS